MKPNKEASKTEEDKKERNIRSSYSELPDEESTPTKTNKKESKTSKDIKESWVFRKSKSVKVKNDPLRFSGDGVNFKAKIIGIENVFDARGNRMCQDALQKLKAAVKTSGEHKQRVFLNISLLGIRIKDEKTGEVLHHHPVHKISFISQDGGDNRAFGYVFGCPQTGHQFFGLKTDKPATQVVCTLRDLFHTALELKKKEIEKAMEQQPEQEDSIEDSKLTNGVQESNGTSRDSTELSLSENKKEENNYFEHNGTVSQSFSTENASNSSYTVDNLLDLQFEMDTLQQGITQMEYSIAATGFGISFSEEDSLDRNSISSGSSYPMTPRKLNRLSSLYHETMSVSSRSSSTSDYTPYPQETSTNVENFANFKNEAVNISPPPPVVQQPTSEPSPKNVVEDRYAVFYEIDSLQSVFDNPTFIHSTSAENIQSELFNAHEDEVIASETVNISEEETLQAKPEVFATLDPLGNNPYVGKEKFFEELRNPPKIPLKTINGNNFNSFQECGDLSNGETSFYPTEKSKNPFINLPPRQIYGTTSAVEENLQAIEEENIASFKNPFNPFLTDGADTFSEMPPTSPPPPPPPPRLPFKDADATSMSPPPRPPNRSSAVPTPPRPRRKVHLGPTTNATWFSFEPEAASWNKQLPSSPPLPVPSRKLPVEYKFEYPAPKSTSASNSPALIRRYSNISATSNGFKEFSESMRITNGGTSGPNKKILTRHTSIIHENWGHNQKPDDVKNPFEISPFTSHDCTEVNQIMNHSPPLPPKTMGIARPRPSPSRKMLSAPLPKATSSTSSSDSKNETVSSSSLRHSSLDENTSFNSASEALYRSSTSSQSDNTFSSGYNGEVSGETVSTESSLEKVSPTSPDSIFRRKEDPFADEFFLTLSKKGTTNRSSSLKKDDSNFSNHLQDNFGKIPAYLEVDVFESKAT